MSSIASGATHSNGYAHWPRVLFAISSLFCTACSSSADASGSDLPSAGGGGSAGRDTPASLGGSTASAGVGGISTASGAAGAVASGTGGAAPRTGQGGAVAMGGTGGALGGAGIGGAQPAGGAGPASSIALLVWDGETKTGGGPDSGRLSSGRSTVATSTAVAHSGTTAVEFGWPGGYNQDYIGWAWAMPVDISAMKTFVFWLKIAPDPATTSLPNDFNLTLLNPNAGTAGEHSFELFQGLVYDGGSGHVTGSLVVPNFADGAWHEVRIPLADMCNNAEHGLDFVPCTGFDKTQASEFAIGFYTDDLGMKFSAYVDDIGFDTH